MRELLNLLTVSILYSCLFLCTSPRCDCHRRRPSAIEHGNEQWYDLESDVAKMAAANAEEQYRYPTCFIVDAFVDPFAAAGTTGNSAAVVPLDSEPSATGSSAGTDQVQWMQTVAREFNLSETAFVWKKTKKQKTDETTIEEEIIENNNNVVHYGIRYFTPSVEVALCGHATLASAAVLYQTQSEKQQQKAAETSTIIFHAPNDVLQASQSTQTSTCNDESNRCTRISMTFPTKPATELSSDEERMAVRRMLRVSLNLDEGEILYMGLSEGLGDLLIEVTRSGFLRIGNDHRQLNFNALLEWDGYTRGVIVCCQEVLPSSTQQGDDGEGKDLAATAPALISVDFLSRFFGPKAGIPEDPVTGSAHCALAPYFCSKLGKPVVIGRQMSQRGGLVECELADDLSSVKLTGTAIITMTGTLWV